MGLGDVLIVYNLPHCGDGGWGGIWLVKLTLTHFNEVQLKSLMTRGQYIKDLTLD